MAPQDPFNVTAPFHLAFPITDIEATRHFYVKVLGCSEGRSTERWIDLNFHGHQLSAHMAEDLQASQATNQLDGQQIPVRHFGVILDWHAWEQLKHDLQTQGIDFLIEPHIRFAQKAGEQGSFFILDPSGNSLEFKAFRNPEQIFSQRS